MKVASTLFSLLLLVSRLGAQDSTASSELLVSSGFLPHPQFLPSGDVFEPSISDAREPRFHQSVVSIKGGSVASSRVWLADHGETIGILRWPFFSEETYTALQLGILVAKFAQFDLRTESKDLINADYMIGIPISLSRGAWSARASLYHVSSHLGDEFIERTHLARVNVSFETLDLRVARDVGNHRLYGGGEVPLRRFPSDLVAVSVRIGAESRVKSASFRIAPDAADGRAYPIASVDVTAPGAQSGGARISAKAGLELTNGRTFGQGGRRLHIVGEYYSGPSQFGQFYRERIRYTGVALQMTL